MKKQEARIRDEIEATKEDLTQNILILRGRIQGEVSAAKKAVESTIDDVKEKARVLSPAYQVQRHPLWMMGGAVVAGFVTGAWLANRGGPPLGREPKRVTHEDWDSEGKGSSLLRDLFFPVGLRLLGRKARDVFPKYGPDIQELVDGCVQRVQKGECERVKRR